MYLSLVEINESQINIRSSERRLQRDSPLHESPRLVELSRLAQCDPEERCTRSRRRIQFHRLPQLGYRSILRAAVPQRNPEVVVHVGDIGPKCYCFFEMQ